MIAKLETALAQLTSACNGFAKDFFAMDYKHIKKNYTETAIEQECSNITSLSTCITKLGELCKKAAEHHKVELQYKRAEA